MFTVEKDIRFEAAHVLPHHDGKCARLHGHSFKATLIFCCPELVAEGPKAGMVLDFGDVTKATKVLLESFLDHFLLNETTGLENPTSEALARFIYQFLHTRAEYGKAVLTEVVVEETCTARARYSPL